VSTFLPEAFAAYYGDEQKYLDHWQNWLKNRAKAKN
jgi:hypothetical protein